MTSKSVYGWRSHYTLFLLLFVYTMSFIDRQIMGILIQPIKQEFQVSDTAMGALSGLIFAVFYSVLAIPFGRYADRANRRNFIAYCCGVWSAMTAFCGMATGFWTLALARTGVAVGEAGGTGPSISMIADHYPPEQRARAMSIYQLGPQLGILFGLALGGWIAHHYGWRAAFLVMSVPGLLAAVALRFTAIEPRRGSWDATPRTPAAAASAEPLKVVLRDLWVSRTFVGISLAGLMIGFVGYGIATWTPAFLVRSHGMSLQGAGAVLGLIGGTAAVAGTLFSGWLTDVLARRNRRWRVGVPVLGCLLALPTGVAFFLMPAGAPMPILGMEVPRAMIFYIVFSSTIVWYAPATFSLLAELVVSHRRATALAVFNLGVTTLGGGLGPLVIGMLSDALVASFGEEALRWSMAMAMSTCMLLAILAFVWTLRSYSQLISKQTA